MKKRLFQVLLLALIAGLIVAVVFLIPRQADSIKGEIVFMDNFRVFEGFAMKKEYDQKLEKEIYSERVKLDSLGAQLERLSKTTSGTALDAKQAAYVYAKNQFEEKFGKLSQEYTSQVYERLNIYISDYGKAHQCKLIVGSGGDGNVMYVDAKTDITEEMIQFINRQYQDQ